jgi:hypothetical protein
MNIAYYARRRDILEQQMLRGQALSPTEISEVKLINQLEVMHNMFTALKNRDLPDFKPFEILTLRWIEDLEHDYTIETWKG